MTGEEVLNIKMIDNDAKAETIRDYLRALLNQVWLHQEGFSSKRPFGNSGWEYELLDSLKENGGFKEEDNLDRLIFKAIEAL